MCTFFPSNISMGRSATTSLGTSPIVGSGTFPIVINCSHCELQSELIIPILRPTFNEITLEAVDIFKGTLKSSNSLLALAKHLRKSSFVKNHLIYGLLVATVDICRDMNWYSQAQLERKYSIALGLSRHKPCQNFVFSTCILFQQRAGSGNYGLRWEKDLLRVSR